MALLSRSVEFLGDEFGDVLAAVLQQQVLRLVLNTRKSQCRLTVNGQHTYELISSTENMKSWTLQSGDAHLCIRTTVALNVNSQQHTTV